VEIDFKGTKFRVYNTMAEYVNGNRMMLMEIESDSPRITPFVGSIMPVEDGAFTVIETDTIKVDDKIFVRVDMCEGDFDIETPAYLSEDALNQEVYQIYTEVQPCVYESDILCFKTREEAEMYMNTFYN
jgi:hypothetical protein